MRRCRGTRVRGTTVGHGQGTHAAVNGFQRGNVGRRRIHVGLRARHVASGTSGSGATSTAAQQNGSGPQWRRRGVRPADRGYWPDQQGGCGRTHGPADVRWHGARTSGQRGREWRPVRGVRPVPASGCVRDGLIRWRRCCGGRRGEEIGPGRHGHGGQLGVAVFRVRAVSHRTD